MMKTIVASRESQTPDFSREGPLSSHPGPHKAQPARAQEAWAAALTQAYPSFLWFFSQLFSGRTPNGGPVWPRSFLVYYSFPPQHKALVETPAVPTSIQAHYSIGGFGVGVKSRIGVFLDLKTP